MTKSLTVAAILVPALSVCLAGQQEINTAAIKNRAATAAVTVLAFDTNGKLLATPIISRFESDNHRNFAGQFHDGAATGIPFGVYDIRGYLTGYSSDATTIAVFQQQVTIVLGLTVGYELPIVPPVLRGHVLGMGNHEREAFVRLTSVFGHRSMDSAIRQDGGFELCGFSDGQYILFVISNGHVVAGRVIRIPYTGKSLEVDIRRDHLFSRDE